MRPLPRASFQRGVAGGPDVAAAQALPARSGPPADGEGFGGRPAAHPWLAAAAWVGGSLAVFALFPRISLGSAVLSDGANSALQGWDLLHGNLLLHRWLIGDANFYFFELPLNAITAAVFGLGDFAAHAASALTYLFVAACAVALAVTDSRGAARAARSAVVVMVLAAPLLTYSAVRLVLEEPDHIGTSVFILGSFLLIDRVPARRITAPLLCVILVAGQFSDLTVRYVAVPAVVLVCGYRALAARRLRSPDSALVAAAVASVPLATLLNAVMVHLGGFRAVASKAHIAPTRLWAHQAAVTWMNIRLLFGAVHGHHTKLGALGFDFRSACLAAAVVGLASVAWRWARRRASRAEQMLFVAIVCNVGIDLISTLAIPGASHEFAVILPCGAVLAARALVPARITSAPIAYAAVSATALAAILPLATAATVPLDKPTSAPLATWLEAHGLTYGVAGYWDASSSTLHAGNRVEIRPVDQVNQGKTITASYYEVDTSWYDPSRHDATFVVTDTLWKYPPSGFERFFGRPAATYRVSNWTILVYRTNLLRLLGGPGYPAPTHPGAGLPWLSSARCPRVTVHG